jgi:hypothetical protein
MMRGTGYSQPSHVLKFEFAFTPSQTLTLAHFHLDQDGISRWHNTNHNPGWNHGSSFTTAGTLGYVIASLYGGWRISDFPRLNLALGHLTNEAYRIHGSGQNKPGRNAPLSIKLE